MKQFFFLLYIAFLCGQDSTKVSNSSSGEMISPVHYTGDSKYTYKDADGNYITVCTGNASLTYQSMKLEAYEIEIHQNTFMVYGRAKVDTLKNGKTKIIGLPKFEEAGTEPLYAMEMQYDFKNRRGKVFDGKTTSEKSRYEGEEIRKFGDKTILIRDGRFTTCEDDTPSYWFHSDQIRMLQNDMVFTGPVFMHLHDIPFPVPLPFGVFSLKRGKRSGIEIPSFEFFDNNVRGRGLSDFGYYWAASEKFQATVLGRYFENTGLDGKLKLEFRNRYDYSGNINFNYTKIVADPNNPHPDFTRNTFQLNYNYRHKFDPSFNISSTGNFQSSNTDNRLERDINSQIQQTLRSTFTLSKIWGEANNNLSVNTSYSDNLVNKDRSLSLGIVNSWTKSKNSLSIDASNSWNPDKKTHNIKLPSLRFTHSARSLFDEGEGKKRWYHDIKYSYSLNYQDNENRTSLFNDSSQTYLVNETDSRRGIQHSPTLTLTGLKLFKYISIAPNISYNELWVDEVATFDRTAKDRNGNDSLVVKRVNEFNARRTYSFGIKLNTNLFGMIEPNLFGLKALRHKVSPSVSLTYNPNFKDESYGYFETFTDTTGNVTYLDKFKFSPFSGTPTGEALYANISVGNSFSVKTEGSKKGEDKKSDIFTFTSSTKYNFLADESVLNEYAWDDLRTSFSIPSSSLPVTFRGSTVHSLYKLNTETGVKTGDKSLIFPMLKNVSLSSSLSLNDKMFRSTSKAKPKEKKSDSGENDMVKGKTLKEKVEYMKGFKYDWSFTANATYNYTPYTTGEKVNTNYNGTFRTNINLTENWRIKYNASLDLKEMDIKRHDIAISRDLGCWTFDFSYEPNDYNRRFMFKIAIKESMLEDIKYERKSGTYN